MRAIVDSAPMDVRGGPAAPGCDAGSSPGMATREALDTAKARRGAPVVEITHATVHISGACWRSVRVLGLDWRASGMCPSQGHTAPHLAQRAARLVAYADHFTMGAPPSPTCVALAAVC